MTTSPIEVSVVIPCLNEANSIAFCIDKALKAFKKSDINGEVVIGDNGSTDGSVTIAEEHGGTNWLVGNNPEKIWSNFLQTLNEVRHPVMPNLWDGHTAERIISAILGFQD